MHKRTKKHFLSGKKKKIKLSDKQIYVASLDDFHDKQYFSLNTC